MQAQATRTNNQAITATQSLVVVKTLLQAGLGCITYLRGLLPADNFTSCNLVSSKESLLSFQSGGGESSRDRDDRNGLNVMTITRGFTEEADKLLNFLEFGIFDALEKKYLRSFVFAIFLDNEDPNNIIEAYTFNFKYHSIPGSDKTIPIMSLGEELEKMSMNGPSKKADPAGETLKRGGVPTFQEVKKSLRVLVKRLIVATTPMEHLPAHRFASFKLHYNDHTPEDYEPPHFRSGDSEKDKWTFATHSGAEAPEKTDFGKLQTPFHGVNIRVASVAPYLPPPKDSDAQPGIDSGGNSDGPPSLTPVQEASIRRDEMETLRKDAETRRVIWLADEDDPDAEGEDDPAYGPDGSYIGYNDSGIAFGPIGIRNDDGEIEPFPGGLVASNDGEALYRGPSLPVASRVGQQMATEFTGNLAQTQQVEETQDLPSERECSTSVDSLNEMAPFEVVMPISNSLPASDFQSAISSQDIDTQALKNMMHVDDTQDTEMLDMETQVVETQLDPIESFGNTAAGSSAPRASFSARTERAIKTMEVFEPENTIAFAQQMGCNIGLASQLMTRLETEGFIAAETTTTKVPNLTKPGHGRKPRTMKGKPTKTIQKSKYVFVQSKKKSHAYRDYFSINYETENRMMGASVTRRSTRVAQGARGRSPLSRSSTVAGEDAPNVDAAEPDDIAMVSPPQSLAQADSQTQEETQFVPTAPASPTVLQPSTNDNKRKTTSFMGSGSLSNKRMKISLATAVDLGD
ncbi:hypothetical protein PLICRDRAFT_698216 [Plicaturopsis crispa FD-325 SS-3]|nr:hypothetical protein PLICRDRAFT_698216 [Plicaturopsis crispa FD-325 SS-3]